MSNEVWDTDNLEPWQIDQLLEIVRQYGEKEWKKGEMAEKGQSYPDDDTYSLYALGEGQNDRKARKGACRRGRIVVRNGGERDRESQR